MKELYIVLLFIFFSLTSGRAQDAIRAPLLQRQMSHYGSETKDENPVVQDDVRVVHSQNVPSGVILKGESSPSILMAPINDDCSAATVLNPNDTSICGQTTDGASIESGEVTTPCGGATADQSVWYKFQATASSMSVWVDNLLSKSCYLGSVVYNTASCVPASGNIISCKQIGATNGIDYWHHLTGLTVNNWYLIQVLYSSGGPCGAGQTFCVSVIAPSSVSGYTQPTSGMAGEYIGACMTNTCSGQFYDNGGTNSNYSNNVNLIYRTFCPDANGKCIKATVNYIDLEEGTDYLYINNGPTQNSPNIDIVSKVGNGTTYTSTDASGCLTFRFSSSSATTYPGWNITLSCVSCTANTSSNNNDCTESTGVCTNSSFTGASAGPGTQSDGCSGCNTSEHFTSWYKFCAQIDGDLQFLIDPLVNTQDYDFALYGPNASCGSLPSPTRCSYAANTGNTGLRTASFDASENVSGDGWVAPLTVTAGDCFYLMISQWSAGGSGFTVDFTGSTANLLDCIVLPVELGYFDAQRVGNYIAVTWNTYSEKNNDYFEVQRSENTTGFETIATVKGKGNSSTLNSYRVTDKTVFGGTIYYRLKQVDFDGNFTYSNIKAVRFYQGNKMVVTTSEGGRKIIVSFNSDVLQKAILSVYDYSGRIVMNHEISCEKGFNNYHYDISGLAGGMYFITLDVDGNPQKEKFIKY